MFHLHIVGKYLNENLDNDDSKFNEFDIQLINLKLKRKRIRTGVEILLSIVGLHSRTQLVSIWFTI
uniref:Uncharacterized protein n=1 Tax=Tetranychus urticae TaxID=32264 RepID=T1L3G4_TETUR